jgi:hypothetical protein
LRERLAALEKEPEPLLALEREGKIPPDPVGEITRFIALYELAFAERTEWRQEMINEDFAEYAGLPPRDDLKDDAIVEPQKNVTAPVDEEVSWRDPALTATKFIPVPGRRHREPCLILHR